MKTEISKTCVAYGLVIVLMFVVFIESVSARTTTVNTSNPLPVNITDNNSNFTCINFPVTGIPSNETVSAVSVTFGFEHQCVLDMQVELRDPSGSRIRQLFGNGLMGLCEGNGFFDIDGTYTFIDTTTNIMNEQQDVFIASGNYRSANYTTMMATSINAAYAGMMPGQANGTWQLCGRDIAQFDTGSFKTSASISITSQVPTSSYASISGQVLSPVGMTVNGAIVTLIDQSGIRRAVRTNSFGYFRFDDVEVGQSYVVEVSSKRYQFNQQVITVNGNIEGLQLSAQF